MLSPYMKLSPCRPFSTQCESVADVTSLAAVKRASLLQIRLGKLQ